MAPESPDRPEPKPEPRPEPSPSPERRAPASPPPAPSAGRWAAAAVALLLTTVVALQVVRVPQGPKPLPPPAAAAVSQESAPLGLARPSLPASQRSAAGSAQSSLTPILGAGEEAPQGPEAVAPVLGDPESPPAAGGEELVPLGQDDSRAADSPSGPGEGIRAPAARRLRTVRPVFNVTEGGESTEGGLRTATIARQQPNPIVSFPSFPAAAPAGGGTGSGGGPAQTAAMLQNMAQAVQQAAAQAGGRVAGAPRRSRAGVGGGQATHSAKPTSGTTSRPGTVRTFGADGGGVAGAVGTVLAEPLDGNKTGCTWAHGPGIIQPASFRLVGTSGGKYIYEVTSNGRQPTISYTFGDHQEMWRISLGAGATVRIVSTQPLSTLWYSVR